MSKEQMVAATKLGIIDLAADSFAAGLDESATIILATPVQQTVKMLREIANSGIERELTITDVGSTKQKVVHFAEKTLPKHYQFIGGHPMAGSHKSGVIAAKDFLFENAFYILTPAKETNRQAVDRLKDLLKGTNAHFIEMTPEEHDGVTSVISHFPHIVAASLVHQAHHFEEQFPLVKRFAAGGFRDITRIASSNPAMWRDILLHNKNKILDRFHEWKRSTALRPLYSKKTLKACSLIFKRQRNIAMDFLLGKKVPFLLFMTFMWMFQITLGSFRRLQGI